MTAVEGDDKDNFIPLLACLCAMGFFLLLLFMF